MKALSYTLFVLSIAMILIPYPAFVYLVKPYAAATHDPDAIEAPAWFLGFLVMFIGAILIPFALGIWLYSRK